MSQQPDIETPQNHRPYEAPTPQTYANQHDPSQTTSNYNKSIVELFWHQMELTCNTQLLHQQTTDAPNNIAKSSSLQKFCISLKISTYFKTKDPQSFDEWLEQIDKVASLMNKDPYRLPLQSLKSHSVGLSGHICPLRDGTKLKNNCSTISVV